VILRFATSQMRMIPTGFERSTGVLAEILKRGNKKSDPVFRWLRLVI
jgi:hypothetical protein